MEDSLEQILAAQFGKLPKVVQEAITSADVEKEMRALAEHHKLHLDQWQVLENEVLMTILGIKPASDVSINIQKSVGVSAEVADALVADITRIVFEPIREQLERELGAPQAREEALSDLDKLREQTLATEHSAPPSPPPQYQGESLVKPPQAPAPATPPPPPPTEKIARAPASGAYQPGETSAARADVHDDPYRVSPV